MFLLYPYIKISAFKPLFFSINMEFLHFFLQNVNIFRIFTLETFTKWTIWFKIRGNKKTKIILFWENCNKESCLCRSQKLEISLNLKVECKAVFKK
ncbi:hypothetical protein CN307_20260 [Bacillus cereus]|uniref:Uncharacterized protein n=1 Tax=Bacillus cereus TaxID=1396 RepID=A0A2A8ZX44_BACCE|nr:hypothetical protein CN307_20260 [Bacillus cereus]